MRRLRLDFQRDLRPLPRAGLALLLVAVMAAAATARLYFNDAAVLAAWQGRADDMESQARRHGVGLSAGETERLAAEVGRANDVLQRIALPWEQLFRAIEAAATKDAALLSLEPDAEKGTLRIAGEARNLPAVLAYVRSLRAQPGLGDVRLLNHQIQQQDPERPVRFALSATWNRQP